MSKTAHAVGAVLAFLLTTANKKELKLVESCKIYRTFENIKIVKPLPSFSNWLKKLRDKPAKICIVERISRLSSGLFGDSKSVGDGVSELRIHVGPGYRLYYTIRQQQVIILLVGVDKSTQATDIEKAKKLAKEIP